MAATGYAWEGATDLILQVRVQPRASRNEWVGLQEDQFRVRITAPPVDGQANMHLRAFLADLFGVAKSQVTLLAGEKGRNKRWRIIAPEQLPPGIESDRSRCTTRRKPNTTTVEQCKPAKP
ncbi:MAG: YggU family protein [Candidatus Competibacteraceae bacterium]|nr:YggU family protein [Candidatus Competibacteraceae bacterium]MCP5132877.1 YggU family protein [Gammaproteobacteria bacterium]